MKTKILAIVFLGISPTTILADGLPSWFKLPDHGKNCVFKDTFLDGPATCGTNQYELWTCLTPNDTGPATSKDYLLVGKIVSDVSSECSPIFSIRSIAKDSRK